MSGKIEFLPEYSFPGFRFCPTDEELILFYLKKKLEGFDNCVDIIAEVDIVQHEPWDLPGKSAITSNNEWYFFSPRGRKYPRGIQSRRATATGYWKATGKERNIKSGSVVIGAKRTLVFHRGRAPTGERTEWLIHEFYMKAAPPDSKVISRLRRKGESNLDDLPGLEPRESLTGDCSLVEDFQHKTVVEEELTVDDFEVDSTALGGFIVDGCYSPLPLGYGYEYEHEHEIFHGESSHPPQDWDDESDYFVPVLDNEIPSLEEASSTPSADPWPKNILNDNFSNVKIKRRPTDAIRPSTPSSQGTARRRIKLSKLTQGYCVNPVGASSSEEGDVRHSSQRRSRRTKMSKPKQNCGDPMKASGDESDVKYSRTSPSLHVASYNQRILALNCSPLLSWFKNVTRWGHRRRS